MINLMGSIGEEKFNKQPAPLLRPHRLCKMARFPLFGFQTERIFQILKINFFALTIIFNEND